MGVVVIVNQENSSNENVLLQRYIAMNTREKNGDIIDGKTIDLERNIAKRIGRDQEPNELQHMDDCLANRIIRISVESWIRQRE